MKEHGGRLISEENTKKAIGLGLVGGVIGWIAGIAALTEVGLVAAASGITYDVYEHRKKK